MKAIMVSVNYADLLTITLPYNRHHFDKIVVVTSMRDPETHRVALENGATVCQTEAFYENGAIFNKFRAMEEGLDVLGRDGWICIMDADVLWPKEVSNYNPLAKTFKCYPQEGKLYTPRRRMFEDVTLPIPQESEWGNYPLQSQSREFAGYTQIFHGSDPALGKAPWHETNWRHCGGADSFFQAKWKEENKIRPPWEVLHLGPAGANWCGRATPRVDGSIPEGADELKEKVRSFIRGRTQGANRFDGEKIL